MNDRLHINNVWEDGEALLVCGTELRHLVAIRGDRTEVYAHVPKGTHNARPFGGGVIANQLPQNRKTWKQQKKELPNPSITLKKIPARKEK